MQLTIGHFVEMNEVKASVENVLVTVREELDQHLDSINSNSLDIQGNYDFLEELNVKIEKLSERLDKLSEQLLKTKDEKSSSQTELTEKEKEVFLVLYTSNEPLSYEEIASRSTMPTYLVEDIISSLVMKKIPIEKKTFAGKVLLILEDEFKQMQSEIGIVDIRN